MELYQILFVVACLVSGALSFWLCILIDAYFKMKERALSRERSLEQRILRFSTPLAFETFKVAEPLARGQLCRLNAEGALVAIESESASVGRAVEDMSYEEEGEQDKEEEGGSGSGAVADGFKSFNLD